LNDERDDPFDRAAEREVHLREEPASADLWRRHQLSVRLKWLAFLILTLPIVLLLSDWSVTTFVIVQLGLITFVAILSAWAWIDVRSTAQLADRHR